MGLKLYYAPGACSLVALVALEEAQASFSAVRLNLANGDQRSADYLAINPKGRVPTLVANGQPITEVIAITAYLNQIFPQVGLLPNEDPHLLARALEIMSWIASTVHVAFAQITRPERYVDDPILKMQLADPGRARFITALSTLETLSATKETWLVGDAFTAVDAYALVVRRWAERIGVDRSAFPAWTEKGDRALKRLSVTRAMAREADPVTAAA